VLGVEPGEKLQGALGVGQGGPGDEKPVEALAGEPRRRASFALSPRRSRAETVAAARPFQSGVSGRGAASSRGGRDGGRAREFAGGGRGGVCGGDQTVG
jgi:hypothetical protein